MVDALFKFLKNFVDLAGIIKIARALKPMVPKRSWVVPHHKVDLAKIIPKEMSASILAQHTNAKHARTLDRMLKGGFVLPRQIMFMLQTEC